MLLATLQFLRLFTYIWELHKYVITCLLFRDEIISPLLWIIFKMFLLKKVRVAKGKRFRKTVLRNQWYCYHYHYYIVLLFFILYYIIYYHYYCCWWRKSAKGRRFKRTVLQNQYQKYKYTKCISTKPLWSRYSNPHCNYEMYNTDDDGESSNLDKLGDGLDVYGVDGHGD